MTNCISKLHWIPFLWMDNLKAKCCLQECNREQGHLYLSDSLTFAWPCLQFAVICPNPKNAGLGKVSAAHIFGLSSPLTPHAPFIQRSCTSIRASLLPSDRMQNSKEDLCTEVENTLSEIFDNYKKSYSWGNSEPQKVMILLEKKIINIHMFALKDKVLLLAFLFTYHKIA